MPAVLRGLAALLLAACLAACAAGCGRPPPPPRSAAKAPAVRGDVPRELGPLVALGYAGDRASWLDAPVRADGRPDFAFRVRLSGDVVAMSLTSSDPHGTPFQRDASIWDTIVGAAPIPPSLGEPCKLGLETIALGVVDASGALLNPDGALPPHRFDDETITIYAPDAQGLFREGRAFTLLVQHPDGAIDRSVVVIL